MIFNGHTQKSINELDSQMAANIQSMYADGMLGNRTIIELLGTLIAGVFNYIRPSNSPAYKIQSVIGGSYEYIFPPLTKEQKKEQVNNSLLAFLTQAPGFDKDRFK